MASQATLEEISETIDRTVLPRPSAGLREFLSSLPQAREFPIGGKASAFRSLPM